MIVRLAYHDSTVKVCRKHRDARMALQASLERSDAERIARNDRAAREHLLAWGLA